MNIPSVGAPAPAGPAAKRSYVQLGRGDLLPRIYPRIGEINNFVVDSCAGRYLVFCFFETAADPAGRNAVEAMVRYGQSLTFERAVLFGISVDPQDEADGRVRDVSRVVRMGFDFDRSASRTLGAASQDGSAPYRRFWLVADPTLHVLSIFPFTDDDPEHRAVFEFLDRLPPPDRYAGFEIPPPVLILPNVFDAELCRRLIDIYDHEGGKESGVMRDGATILDKGFKRRRDIVLTDSAIVRPLQQIFTRRVCPEIERLFFMKITRMERYIVGCYAAEDGGHFGPHRDNDPGITAYRRFAVSINLNSDFEGGEVCFPEYNSRGYKAPPGWAVVFPCAILHRVTSVRSGKRYAFLPFVYDEAGKRIRDAYTAARAAEPSPGAEARQEAPAPAAYPVA
jgi:predicted 2-oxoglutarate/Fe(II)-dependent dioxygenase YbiX